jgi:putative DNA primase/helicase
VSTLAAATRDVDEPAFGPVVLRYLSEHAVDPATAWALGVRGVDELIYPYPSPKTKQFVRRRPMGPGKNRTLQPDGVNLCLWWPQEHPIHDEDVVLLCEGEPDALAAVCALLHGRFEATIAAVPGTGIPAARIAAEISATTATEVCLCLDPDESGRALRGRLVGELSKADLRISELILEEGHDLADTLRQQGPDGPDWLANRIADASAVQDEAGTSRSTIPSTSASFSDLGNARRLVARHGADLRFCAQEKTWYVWTGTRWKRDASEEVSRRAIETVDAMYTDAVEQLSGTRRAKLLQWARQSESKNKLQAMVSVARSDAAVAVEPQAFDRAPWILNTLNGAVDLRTGELRPAKREDLLTVQADVEYDTDARSPVWERFLDDVCGNDPLLAEFLQRAVGYTITGETGAETFFFVHGPAGTGKSTLFEAIRAMLGPYAAATNFDTWKVQRSSGPRNDLARLLGKRLVTASEGDQDARLDVGLLKSFTGGEMLTARRLYQEHFEFQPTAKLWLASNHLPNVPDLDSGLWRRMLLIPFVNRPDHAHPGVKRELTSNPRLRSALLRWAVEGAQRWYGDQTLEPPPVVRAAVETLKRSANPLADWVAEHTEPDAEAIVLSREFYHHYCAYAEASGTKPLVSREWGKRLRLAGAHDLRVRVAGTQQRAWQGLRLLT